GGEPSTEDSTLHGTVKVLDIGLGRAVRYEAAGKESPGHLTQEGTLLGTPDYMAPEQAQHPHDADIRADIYALGCVLYQCRTEQPPSPDTNVLRQVIRHAADPAVPVTMLNPTVPAGLQQVVEQMMAKDPAQRYPTPAQAALAMQPFLPSAKAAMPAVPV